MDYSNKIADEINNAARMKPDYVIQTAEEIIPLMDVDAYSEKILDIAYADETEAEKLDIFYPPARKGKMPVLIEVHGGGWYFGQKRSVEFEPFLVGLKRGFICVSVGYTLSPAAHYPQPVLEIKSAIRYLRRNAAKYGIDPDRIVLWGGSAGAHLTALAATSCDTGYLQRDLNGDCEYSAKPNVLALWYGCFAMEKMKDIWMAHNFMGLEDFAKAQEDIRLANPINHITNQVCPVFMQHGKADRIVDYTQSTVFYKKLQEMTGRKTDILELLDGYDHADARMFLEENINKVYDFAEKTFESCEPA